LTPHRRRAADTASKTQPAAASNIVVVPGFLTAALTRPIFIPPLVRNMKITPIPTERHHGRSSLPGRSFPRTTGLIASAILGLSGLPQSARSMESGVATACHTAGGELAKIEAIDTTLMKAATGDLPFILVTDKLNGARVRIYHEPDLAAAALNRAACFGGLLRLLRPNIPDARKDTAWAALVLTRDKGYVPPRDRAERRWILPDFAGQWDDAAQEFLLLVMPHEQTHDSQASRRATKLPRWFQEGHATWSGLQVTKTVAPEIAELRLAQLRAALAQLSKPQLAKWGGIAIKPEAIERQLSAVDRERRAKDPTYVPKGPFSFGPGDFVEENSNEEGRYGAALALFKGIEKRHGRTALLHWIDAVLSSSSNDEIVPLAQAILHEDLSPLLR